MWLYAAVVEDEMPEVAQEEEQNTAEHVELFGCHHGHSKHVAGSRTKISMIVQFNIYIILIF